MTWTPNRPTEPGRYEVYLAMNSREDDLRGRLPTGYGIADIYLDPTYRDLAVGFTGGGMGYAVADSRFDGALWRPYVEPPDPFAEPVPSLRERVEALPTYGYHGGLDEIARRRGGDYLKRSEVLALFEVPQ